MELLETLLGAFLASATSIIVCVINNNTTRKKHDAEFMENYQNKQKEIMQDYKNGIQELKDQITSIKHDNDMTRQAIEMRLDALEKKQDKHNSVIERMFLAEKNIEMHEEKIKVANKRIGDLERHEENKA